jgi:arginase family enzyme
MDMTPPNSHLLKPTRSPEHRFAYIGVPHDAATSLGNPGGRFGPQALREALQDIFDWRLQDGQLAHIDRGIVDLSAVEVADFGDIALSYYDRDKTVEET